MSPPAAGAAAALSAGLSAGLAAVSAGLAAVSAGFAAVSAGFLSPAAGAAGVASLSLLQANAPSARPKAIITPMIFFIVVAPFREGSFAARKLAEPGRANKKA